jgi:hypothetical protein
MSKLNFSLQALVDSVTTRAEKGVLLLALDDKNVQGLYTYKKLSKVTDSWESANKAYISKAFSDYGVKKVIVASSHTGGDATTAGKDNISNSLDTILSLLNKVYENGYVVAPQATATADKVKVANFVKSQRNDQDYPIKGVIYNYASDNEGIINFTGTNLGSITSDDYVVDVASLLCTLGANESITNHVAKNVTGCDIKADDDVCVSNGELFLFNNGTDLVFSRGVNSLQTIATGQSEVLTKIRVIEVLDMVKSDFREIFINKYLGKYGNSYANRKTLVSTLNTYLKGISTDGYLSNDDTSYCSLDVDATKAYLESLGTDTDEMDDATILKQKIGTHVFIIAKIFVMDSIEDISVVLQYES